MASDPLTQPARGGLPARIWRLHTATPARIIVTIASLAGLLWSMEFVYQYFVSPVWSDIYRWVDDFQLFTDGRYTFHDLIKPHNEHRIATTRLLLLLDSLVFDMNGRSTVIINLGILAAVGLLVWRLVGLDGMARTPWVAPPLFWAALLCAVCQSGNLIFAFQVQFALTCVSLCGAASLLTAATQAPAGRPMWLAAAAGSCAILAAFSMAAGVFAAPALLALMLLRRARGAVWLGFVPVCGLGLVLFFRHYESAVSPVYRLFEWHFVQLRAVYIANFLASGLAAYPHLAPYAGLAGLILFGGAAGVLLWSYTARRQSLPAGDAALVALGLFVLLCAVSGTLTTRIQLGAQGALVSRYATMSLLFGAVLLGLYGRIAARWFASRVPGQGRLAWFAHAAPAAAALACLRAADLPDYRGMAGGLRAAVNGEAELLVNNIGIDGPYPVAPYQGVDSVRGAIAFMHAHQLNMFSPESRLPASLRAQLRRSTLVTLPACVGAIDFGYALDGTGFLISGWAADPQAKRTAAWIAALDASGNVLGAARAMRLRPDLPASLGASAFGFESGFRLHGNDLGKAAGTDPDAPALVRVAGLFSGAGRSPCVLPGAARIGPVQVAPATELGHPAVTAFSVKADGFVAAPGAADTPGGGPAWRLAPGLHGDATLEFTVTPSAAPALPVH